MTRALDFARLIALSALTAGLLMLAFAAAGAPYGSAV